MKYQSIPMDKDEKGPADEQRGWKYEALSFPRHQMFGRGDTPQEALDALLAVRKMQRVKDGTDKVTIVRRWVTKYELEEGIQDWVMDARPLKGFTKAELSPDVLERIDRARKKALEAMTPPAGPLLGEPQGLSQETLDKFKRGKQSHGRMGEDIDLSAFGL